MSELKPAKSAESASRTLPSSLPAMQRQPAMIDQRQTSAQLRQLKALADGGPRAIAQGKMARMADRGAAPIQAVTFSRPWSSLHWTSAEWEIDGKERKTRQFQLTMRPYAKRFPEILQFGMELDTIRDTEIAEDQMKVTLGRLNAIQIRLDAISSEIARVGMLAGDSVMDGYGQNAADSTAGRISTIIINTIDLLPAVFHSPENFSTIKFALHPDVETKGVGFKEEWLGESDVAFAKMRHSQLLANLFRLEAKIRTDWEALKRKFRLTGTLSHIQLTGSDLHKGGQQVVIIQSSGGQKVVYKPRSVAPDAALLDAETGVFSALNEMGAELPTMDFQAAGEHAGYTEFVSQVPLRTVAEIKKYYRQMGQLVVAAKLFGVNDLHYENIMAAGRGPTIIDGETSFLLNVMTARDFQSNELQLGLFKHVSEIDNKLSNNSFYTAAEKLEWDNRKIDDWDEFIGDKRNADVQKGGPYEADLSQGITQLLQILRTNRDKINTLATSQVDQLEEVRVVPVETKLFKSNMSSYRAHVRNGDQVRMDRTIKGCSDQVCQELEAAGYRLHGKRGIRARLTEDFDQGDIPVLHYNGRTKKLMWNGRVVGSFGDKRATKKPVGDNITWLVRRTAQDVLDSLQA